MNIIIGLVALFSCTYFGFNFSKKFTSRKTFYFDFNEFNKIIKNEINYSQNTLYSILKNNTNTDSDFYKVLKNVILSKEKFTSNQKYLESDELSYFKSYIEKVGSGDKFSQIKFIDNAYEYVNEKYKIASEDEKKYKKLYIKLGFLVGLIIFIVLI